MAFDTNNPLGFRRKNPYGGTFNTPSIGGIPQAPPLVRGGGRDVWDSALGPERPMGQNIYANIDFRNIQQPTTSSTRPYFLPGAPNVGQSGTTGAPGSAIERYYERMLDLAPTRRQQALGDLGSTFGAFAGDERTNRVVRGNAFQEFDRMMLEREAAKNRIGLDANSDFDRNSLLARADKRDANSTAMQWSQLAGHLQRGDRVSDSRTGSTSYTPASDQERAAATGLAQQAHDNLTDPGYQPTKYEGNWDYTPKDPSTYANPGRLEQIGRYAGMGSNVVGLVDQLTGGRSGDKIAGWLGRIPGVGRFFGNGASAASTTTGALVPSANYTNMGIQAGMGGPAGNAAAAGGSKISSIMGKAAPIAGAAMGTYGLLKNRGTVNNIANGAMAGAGYGSFIPGIGTAIGAGIGAGVGYLRGKFGPSQQELQGRGTAADARSALTGNATEAQQQEAQASGQGPHALTHIVLRDRFGEEAAGNYTRQLFEAEKRGPQAVQQVLAQIQGTRT